MAYNIDQIKEQIDCKYKKMQSYITAIKNPNLDPGLKKKYEQYLGDELCCSITATSDLDEATKDLGPCYMYDDDGNCYFDYKGVRFTVADVRSMRKSPRINKETYFDIAIVLVDRYRDDCWQYDILPCYSYGSSLDEEFGEFKPVCDLFIDAADKYINENPDVIKEQEENESSSY